jgi:hypothetical protein
MHGIGVERIGAAGEPQDYNGTNTSNNYIASPAPRGAADLALQPGLGVLSQRWAWFGARHFAYSRGVTESLRAPGIQQVRSMLAASG